MIKRDETNWREVRDAMADRFDEEQSMTIDGYAETFSFKEGWSAAIEHDPRVKALRAAAVKLGLMKDVYNPDYIPSIHDLIDAEEEFKQALAAWEEK